MAVRSLEFVKKHFLRNKTNKRAIVQKNHVQ